MGSRDGLDAGLGSQKSLRLSSVICGGLRVRVGRGQLRLGVKGRLGSADGDLTGANFMTALVVLRARLVGLPGYARGRALRLLGGFAGNGRRFRHGSGLPCGFRRGLFAVGSADLGKRRRVVAFRAGSACETAQKLQAGLSGR